MSRALWRVEARGMALAERVAARRRGAIVRAVEDGFPGIVAIEDAEGVVIEGRDLLRRWLADARLRDVGAER